MAADGRERVLAPCPELQPLFLALREFDEGSALAARDVRYAIDQIVDLGGRAIHFADDDQLRIAWISARREVLGGDNGHAVHHFEAARYDAAGDDRSHTVGPGFNARKPNKNAARALRLSQNTNRDFGDDAEQTLGPRHQAHEIVELGIEMLAAKPHHLAAHQYDFETKNVVGRQAVFQTVHAA